MDSTATAGDCKQHPGNAQRGSCAECRAAYMRRYLRERRRRDPLWALLERARSRSRKAGIEFALTSDNLELPTRCPALGIEICVGDRRTNGSPSLDRLDPARGYVPDNVRVISDRANRLKGDRGVAALLSLATRGNPARREEFRLLAQYVEREQLLAAVRRKAALGGKLGREWEAVARFLDRVFRSGRHAVDVGPSVSTARRLGSV